MGSIAMILIDFDSIDKYVEYLNTFSTDKIIFDAQKAQKAIDFFPTFLVHVEGSNAGKPFQLFDWQDELIRIVFGVVFEETGRRLYQTVFIFIGKKNGKSGFLSALSLMLLAENNGDFQKEVYAAAYDKYQATIIFSASQKMVENSPILSRAIKITGSMKEMRLIRWIANGDKKIKDTSLYKALSLESKNKEGLKPSVAIIDELHIFGRDRKLYDMLMIGASASRPEPLRFMLTTAGNDPAEGLNVAYDEYIRAKKIKKHPENDLTYFPVIFEMSKNEFEEMENIESKYIKYRISVETEKSKPNLKKEKTFLDEISKNWHKPNPSIGKIFDRKQILREYKSLVLDPSKLTNFKQRRLNRWVSESALELWIDFNLWKDRQFEGKLDDYAGKPCFLGLDLSSSDDITCLAIAFRSGDTVDVFVKSWLPIANIVEKERKDQVPYRRWAHDGFLTLTEGAAVDQHSVEQYIISLKQKFDIQYLQRDAWNAAYLTTNLQNHGIMVLDFRQGWRTLSPGTKQLQGLILGKKFRYAKNPMLDWMSMNTTLWRDTAGNIKPQKKFGNRKFKIDGIIATIMAVSGAMKKPPEESLLNLTDKIQKTISKERV